MIVGSLPELKKRPPEPAWWTPRNTDGPLLFTIVIIDPSIDFNWPAA